MSIDSTAAGWQPIATAPLDGTPVRIRHREVPSVVMAWNSSTRRWEGYSFTVLRTYWCPKEPQQPEEWQPVWA